MQLFIHLSARDYKKQGVDLGEILRFILRRIALSSYHLTENLSKDIESA